MNITTDEGPPVLAIEQGAATEAERSEWVRQLQIPMIYQVSGKKEFMLVHRTSAGAAATERLHGAANLADAAVKARSFLVEHPGDAMLSNYDKDWKTYNDRESSNLMNIVAVIYGVALTAAISGRPSLILHPVSARNLIPSLALLAAGLLAAVSFYGYVLSVGGDKPYDVTWTIGSNKTRGTVRFFADLVLATLYVHLLLAATHVETGSNRAPKLTGFVLAFVLVFAVGAVVWGLRGRLQWIAIGATGVTLALCWFAYVRTPTRSFDFKLVGALLFIVILYGVLNHVIPYRTWKNHSARSGPPRRDLRKATGRDGRGQDQTADQQSRSVAMPRPRHCRHCWFDCGGCWLPGEAGDKGLCIHKPNPSLSWPNRFPLLGTRRFWRRVFWGP